MPIPDKFRSDQYLRLINDMIEDRMFNDDTGFLKSVRDFIKHTGLITIKQMKAIDKIYIKKAERE